MSGAIFIPKNLRVGFVERGGTFDGKLSYIIYYNAAGKICKELSFNNWRDHKIDTLEIENTPVSDLSLNKSVRRCNYHFGSGKHMIRVYDPRGFEYEITPENLVAILDYVDLIKGEFQGEFVYSYIGKDLMLIPTNTPQYQEAVKSTAVKNAKVSSKDLIPGNLYPRKDGSGNVVYVGRYFMPTYGDYNEKKESFFKNNPKEHIFSSDGHFFALSASTIGNSVSELSESETKDLINEFLLKNNQTGISKISFSNKLEHREEFIEPKANLNNYSGNNLYLYHFENKNEYREFVIYLETNYYNRSSPHLNIMGIQIGVSSERQSYFADDAGAVHIKKIDERRRYGYGYGDSENAKKYYTMSQKHMDEIQKLVEADEKIKLISPNNKSEIRNRAKEIIFDYIRSSDNIYVPTVVFNDGSSKHTALS